MVVAGGAQCLRPSYCDRTRVRRQVRCLHSRLRLRERRGAPVVSFIRASEQPIRQLTNIYAPDCIVCVDPASPAPEHLRRLKPGGTWCGRPRARSPRSTCPTASAPSACATRCASPPDLRPPDHQRLMLGAFARSTGPESRSGAEEGDRAIRFPATPPAQNLDALERGCTETTITALERRITA